MPLRRRTYLLAFNCTWEDQWGTVKPSALSVFPSFNVNEAAALDVCTGGWRLGGGGWSAATLLLKSLPWFFWKKKKMPALEPQWRSRSGCLTASIPLGSLLHLPSLCPCRCTVFIFSRFPADEQLNSSTERRSGMRPRMGWNNRCVLIYCSPTAPPPLAQSVPQAGSGPHAPFWKM